MGASDDRSDGSPADGCVLLRGSPHLSAAVVGGFGVGPGCATRRSLRKLRGVVARFGSAGYALSHPVTAIAHADYLGYRAGGGIKGLCVVFFVLMRA